MSKLTYDEWKATQTVEFAAGVREDLAKIHDLNIEEVIDDILRKLYSQYLADETVPKD